MLLADHVFLVRPRAFGFNEEAARTNRFATRGPDPANPASAANAAARAELDALERALREEGVGVSAFEDLPEPPKPDAVFPNNWVSFHPDGTRVLYPMAPANRRPERRNDIVDALAPLHGTRHTVDLTALEEQGEALEGTGALVMDHARRHAWVARSPRATDRAIRMFAERVGYEVTTFDTALDGAPVYHTNVVLALGPTWALWAPALITAGRDALERSLAPRKLLALTPDAVRRFAANVLVLQGRHGPVTFASAAAHAALAPHLGDLGRVRATPLPTLEAVGGGSCRCTLAEVHRPQASK